MNSLLDIRNLINNYIGKYEAYIKPVGKLILSLFVFMTINGKMGYMDKLNNIAIVLIAALLCSFMPGGFMLLVAAGFIVMHMYALSLECAIVVLVLFMVLFLLYIRLQSGETFSLAITPILTSMSIPYIMPVAMGLLKGPASAASVGCGVIIGRVLMDINSNADALSSMESDDMANRFRLIIDTLMADKLMILLVVAFIITILVVYFITQMSIDYSWAIAVVAGAMIDAIVVLVGDLVMNAQMSVIGLLFGSILSVIVGAVVVFFKYNLDYSKTQKVQFQDDEYMYYVKAVPLRNGHKKTKKVAARRRTE